MLRGGDGAAEDEAWRKGRGDIGAARWQVNG